MHRWLVDAPEDFVSCFSMYGRSLSALHMDHIVKTTVLSVLEEDDLRDVLMERKIEFELCVDAVVNIGGVKVLREINGREPTTTGKSDDAESVVGKPDDVITLDGVTFAHLMNNQDVLEMILRECVSREQMNHFVASGVSRRYNICIAGVCKAAMGAVANHLSPTKVSNSVAPVVQLQPSYVITNSDHQLIQTATQRLSSDPKLVWNAEQREKVRIPHRTATLLFALVGNGLTLCH